MMECAALAREDLLRLLEIPMTFPGGGEPVHAVPAEQGAALHGCERRFVCQGGVVPALRQGTDRRIVLRDLREARPGQGQAVTVQAIAFRERVDACAAQDGRWRK